MPISFFFILLSFSQIETNAVYESYINQYKYLAIQEMQRTGIPASIKLSQALLESNAGRSVLAKKANNHFGIKCGGSWNGETFYRNDDDFEKGKLIPSCFRKFSHVEESFIAHSEFLMDPKKVKRYGFLFDYSSTEYKKWARGLKKAGYATNSKYADLLIDIIERYRLYELDQKKYNKQKHKKTPAVVEQGKTVEKVKKVEKPKPEKVTTHTSTKRIQVENDVDFILAKPGERVSEISKKYGIPEKKLYLYNEHLAETRGKINEDSRIYLKQKRNNYRGKQRVHRVKKEDSMYDISQNYGIKLKSLYKKNKMNEKTQPAIGEHIYIRGKRPKGDVVKIRRKTFERENSNNNPSPNSPQIDASDQDNSNTQDQLKGNHSDPIELGVKYYIVKKGDTLYNISKRFDLSTSQLQEMNGLIDNVIFVGQKIRVE